MPVKPMTSEITIVNVTMHKFVVHILGTTPIILNCMSQKVMRELLLPRGKKTAADKAQSLKHDPLQEFRDSPYKIPDGPTAIGIPAGAFKQAMCTAALDTPGTARTQIRRLIYVHGQLLPIYGLPQLFMAVTRSADINKTPDVRSRCILPEWAVELCIEYPSPMLNATAIGNLLVTAGFTAGVGDWRQEKGSGNYGSFKIVAHDDPDYQRIVSSYGRKEQLAALQDPEPHDIETQNLLSWYQVELRRRGFKEAA